MRRKIFARRFISLALAAMLGVGLVGCGSKGGTMSSEEQQAKFEQDKKDKEEKKQNSGGDTAGYNPYPDGPNIRTSFRDYATVGSYEINTNPSVDSYQIAEDFSNVNNADRFYELQSDEEFRNRLLTNGFVVRENYGDEFFDLYENNRYEYIPNFVTTDSMLHTYHLYFAYLLKSLEKGYFYDNMKTVTGIMCEQAKAQYDALTGTEWENAAKRNMAYFGVAARLLDPEAAVDPAVADVVDQELAYIEAAGGITESPMMNIGGLAAQPLQEDYSQYKVRGYYTESEQLSRYFKTVMWYGRMTFRASEEDETRSAILITKAMENEEALSNWRGVYDVTSFFVGNSDDPGVYDYYPVVESVYPDMNIASIAGDADRWEEINAALKALKAPVINSVPVDDGKSEEDKAAAIVGFRFMGQRSTFDAAVFQQLIYSNVDDRYLPTAMDIPAVLGSTEAENILREEGHFNYNRYEAQYNKVKENVAATDESVWSSTLYNNWIHTLRPLTVEKGEGYPMFMQNKAWSRKQLNTFLGSYTELKHDTVLYAKQVYAEMGGGGDINEIDFRGYVEPEPEVFARIATLAAMTRDGLAGYGMISEHDAEMLTLLQQLAEQLLNIANKELANETLTAEEYELIETYGGQLEHFWAEVIKGEDPNASLSAREHPAALVTDIATDPNGACLEVGTGGVDKIYVVVNVEGVLRIATGTVYSFYEFTQPLDQRLTDTEWKIMLGIEQEVGPDGYPIFDSEREKVEQPSWISEFKLYNNW